MVRKTKTLVGSVGVALVAAVVFPAAAGAAEALAGFTEIDITPPLGIALGGRGCTITHADGVLHPLGAGVTVLKDADGNTVVLVSFDLPGVSCRLGEEIRSGVAAKLGIASEYVLLNCSHTHSGPMMYREIMAGCGEAAPDERDYMKALARRIVEAASAAAGNLRPVVVRFHEGRCDVGINRRGKLPSGEMGMVPSPEAPYDPRVWIMHLTSPGGQTRAVIFSYACHPVIVYGYALSKISAEYPGVARREIRAALGQDVHVQFIQGAAGNIRPRVLADLKERRFRKSTPQDVEHAGKELASAVLKALSSDGRTGTLRLAASMDQVSLRRGTPPPRKFYEDLLKTDQGRAAAAARYWLDRYDKGGPFEKGDRWPVGVIRLTQDQWVLYFAGEPVIEWAKHAAEWFRDRSVVVWGYSQQVSGYLPVDEILDEGGYEVVTSNLYRVGTPAPLAPGLNEAIRGSVLRQIAKIEGAATSRAQGRL